MCKQILVALLVLCCMSCSTVHRKAITPLPPLTVRKLVTPGTPAVVTLLWDYDTNVVTPDLIFKIYHTTNLTVPDWSVITNVAGTNLSVQLSILPAAHFFTATASNFWGESAYSNTASTPPVAPNPVISIRKGP